MTSDRNAPVGGPLDAKLRNTLERRHLPRTTLIEDELLLELLENPATYLRLDGVRLRTGRRLVKKGLAFVHPRRRFQLSNTGRQVAKQLPTPAEG